MEKIRKPFKSIFFLFWPPWHLELSLTVDVLDLACSCIQSSSYTTAIKDVKNGSPRTNQSRRKRYSPIKAWKPHKCQPFGEYIGCRCGLRREENTCLVNSFPPHVINSFTSKYAYFSRPTSLPLVHLLTSGIVVMVTGVIYKWQYKDIYIYI